MSEWTKLTKADVEYLCQQLEYSKYLDEITRWA